ncbi:hypothetical protein [Pseudochryseolinea flava]|uniref:Uncharacterized protein n=1 Tax=Pseudochryseolinea flava TaxID=2059302 RepID=A0A364XVG5_9BACT|nr:hypothetical protein [Pseudochryseolinea flava]RAV97946.1 hypothetical protein DQQ10_26100 [Pseudochryseolinea flava]
MERRDILKEQIEQLGKLLGKMLSTFLKLKSEGSTDVAFITTQAQAHEILGVHFEAFLQHDKDSMIELLKKKGFTDTHVEHLVDYFIAVGNAKLKDGDKSGLLLLNKATSLLDIADLISKTASLTRLEYKNRIQLTIDSNKKKSDDNHPTSF